MAILTGIIEPTAIRIRPASRIEPVCCIHNRLTAIQAVWISLIFMASLILFAQTARADTGAEANLEYRVKAAFLLNFCQFVTWPEAAPTEKPDAPFTLCVIGENPFKSDLETIAGKTVRGRPLEIRFASSADNLPPCHLLFAGKSDPKELATLLAKVKTRPILTVGDMEDFARQGGIIAFVKIDNKIRFEINPRAAEMAGLKISSQLLKLAIISDDARTRGN